MSQYQKQPPATMRPTFDQVELEKLTREVRGSESLAWDICALFERTPALCEKHPFLYLRARQRLERSRNWFRFGRTLGRASRWLADSANGVFRWLRGYANRHQAVRVA